MADDPKDTSDAEETAWSKLLDLKDTRKELGVTQTELATTLGVSPRTVQSCEQGWRKPSTSLEKNLVLLRIAHRSGATLNEKKCWEVIQCSQEARDKCMVYRTQQGHLCWFLTGNECKGRQLRDWKAKKEVCGDCEFFQKLLEVADEGK